MHNSNPIYIEDLLSDENFIKWVKHPNREHDLYWNAWLQSHPERKPDVLLAKEILIRSAFRHTPPSQKAYEEVLHWLMKREAKPANLSSRPATDRKRIWGFQVKVAASLALLALASAFIIWGLYESGMAGQQKATTAWITKQNPAGMRSQLQLPDGTMVWLNAESTLKYPPAFDSVSRNVVLVGEAFFDVVKDVQRPFTVQSGHLNTTALGTSFNISAYLQEETLEISLVTGKVMISEKQAGPQDEIILESGEQVIYTGREQDFLKTNFDYNTSLGWKDGLLVFSEADIVQIKRKLERWYGVQIEVRGVPEQNWKINGAFKNQSLERVLERLSFSKAFTFQISDKIVIMDFTTSNNP